MQGRRGGKGKRGRVNGLICHSCQKVVKPQIKLISFVWPITKDFTGLFIEFSIWKRGKFVFRSSKGLCVVRVGEIPTALLYHPYMRLRLLFFCVRRVLSVFPFSSSSPLPRLLDPTLIPLAQNSFMKNSPYLNSISNYKTIHFRTSWPSSIIF